MKLAVIVAVAENGVIGRDNDLPWHLPADLKRFKALTTGHTIVMGRKTYESIGRALPNRRSIVVSRNPDFDAEGVEVVASLESALDLARNDDDTVFVIGGRSMFADALPEADEAFVTRVHSQVDGDVYFPPFDDSEWECVDRESHEPDDSHEHPFTFEHLVRKGSR